MFNGLKLRLLGRDLLFVGFVLGVGTLAALAAGFVAAVFGVVNA